MSEPKNDKNAGFHSPDGRRRRASSSQRKRSISICDSQARFRSASARACCSSARFRSASARFPVDLAFGAYAEYGQIVKNYRNATMIYTPSEMVGADRRVVCGDFDARKVCTSHVERHNLTIRTLMKRFTRLSLGFSKKLENLEAAIAAFIAFYNYCWRPRKPGKAGRRMPTPAIMAGLADHPWTFAELFGAVWGG